MDPEEMQTGTAKPAGHPKPETETNLQTGRRAQDPRNLHKIRIESGRPAAATGYTPRRRKNAPRTRKHAASIEHHTGRQTALKSAYI